MWNVSIVETRPPKETVSRSLKTHNQNTLEMTAAQWPRVNTTLAVYVCIYVCIYVCTVHTYRPWLPWGSARGRDSPTVDTECRCCLSADGACMALTAPILLLVGAPRIPSQAITEAQQGSLARGFMTRINQGSVAAQAGITVRRGTTAAILSRQTSVERTQS
jgi:hypothetical protein